jgi:hypothetical protein
MGEPAALASVGESRPASASSSANDALSHDHTETTRPLTQESLPEDGTGRAAAEKQDDESNVWEPEPESDPLNQTDALTPHARPPEAEPKQAPSARPGERKAEPGTASRRANPEPRRPTAVFRSEDQKGIDHDADSTQKLQQDTVPLASAPDLGSPLPSSSAPAAPSNATGAKPATGSEERAFYITVLGRRIGPLTRAVARELKARELRGSLTTADLEGYPLG